MSSAWGRPNIAVIVCLYNSDIRKGMATVVSIARQSLPCFEVVFADDGSANDISNQLSDYLVNCGFERSRISISKQSNNTGTVSNILNALHYVNAPYVAFLSPGDLFYDEYSLEKYVAKLTTDSVDIVFGKGVYYTAEDSITIHNVCRPVIPSWLDTRLVGRKIAIESIAVNHNYVLGAAIAYKKDALQYALELLAGHVKYVEDNTTLLIVLLEGGTVSFIDNFVVWYEYGTGISTSANSASMKRISDDYSAFWQMMVERYPDNDYVESALLMDKFKQLGSWRGFIVKALWMIIHPSILVKWVKKAIAARRYRCEGYDLIKLQSAINVADSEYKSIGV